MQVHPITDLEFSSLATLPTTRAQHGEDRNNKIYARDPKQPQNLENALAVTVLPTPVTTDGKPVDVANQVATRNSLQLQSITAILEMPKETWEKTDLSANKARQNGKGARRRNKMLPTPTTRDYKDGTEPHERDGVVQTDTVARAVFNSGEVSATNWGKFEPAIRRWEEALGRPAPAPTKPDGKEGAHRLSSAFTEWMMGLPEGWITDVGLSRNDELKACGNGVVPQQAELALRVLLAGVALPRGGGK
jgi:hypothetical protein